MKGSFNYRNPLRMLLLALGLLAGVGLTGCQAEAGGQTLPSPYYMSDDVQYFPPGVGVQARQGSRRHEGVQPGSGGAASGQTAEFARDTPNAGRGPC